MWATSWSGPGLSGHPCPYISPGLLCPSLRTLFPGSKCTTLSSVLAFSTCSSLCMAHSLLPPHSSTSYLLVVLLLLRRFPWPLKCGLDAMLWTFLASPTPPLHELPHMDGSSLCSNGLSAQGGQGSLYVVHGSLSRMNGFPAPGTWLVLNKKNISPIEWKLSL